MKKHIFLLFLIAPLAIFSQQILRGTVVDDTNFPLPGASIIIKGTTKGVVTNIDGEFELSLSNRPSTIVVSYLGFKNKEIVIDKQTQLNIVLDSNEEQLNEIVVIGYGAVEKGDLTGAVTSIKPKENVANQTQNIETLLQGRVAGVQVTTNGNQPGSPVSVKIRGTGSLTSNTQPLYVVDGIIVNSATEDNADPLSSNSFLATQGGISGIDPADIESFEVLKDASATAIYGSRGANGVIIITTKKGKKGKAVIRYNTSTTIGHIVRDIDVLNPEEFVNYVNLHPDSKELILNDDGVIVDASNPNTILQQANWSNEIYETSISTKHRISASGGSDSGDYFISGGYLNNEGIIPGSKAERIDLNLNLNNNLNDKLKLGTKIAATYTETSISKGTDILGGANNSLIRNINKRAPFYNFGGEEEDEEITIDIPTAWIDGYDDDAEEIRILGAANLEYKITKDLEYKILLGADYRSKERSIWYGSELRRGRLVGAEAGISNLNRFKYNIDNTLTYKKRFNKNHRINAVAGVTYDKLTIESQSYNATGFTNEALRADGISLGNNRSPLFLIKQGETYLSGLARVNYTLFNKYNFTATIRADGSSKFAEGKRWGYFPSAAFAWNINKENFLKKSNTINDLKLRLGWGQTGNSNIPNYRYFNYFTNGGIISDGSGSAQTALVLSQLGNEDLIWETTQQYNAGLDLGLFEDRITATFDMYYKDSKDLLLNVAIGPSAGYENYFANQGSIVNKGFEIGLNALIIDTENIKWSVYGNISVNRNEIQSLGIPAGQFGTESGSGFLGSRPSNGRYLRTPVNIFLEGRESGLFYGYETNGIVTEGNLAGAPALPNGDPAQLGDVFFVDQNGDGVADTRDLTVIGNPNPDYTYGFGTSFTYKNFSFSALFNGTEGNQLINSNLLSELDTFNETQNVRTSALYNAYDPIANPNGTEPRIGYNVDVATSSTLTDRAIEDASFLRLTNVVLNYNIPFVKKQKSFIDRAEVYVSGSNLFVWTDYNGYDPEVDSFSFDPSRVGIDWNAFPNSRTYSLGINLTF